MAARVLYLHHVGALSGAEASLRLLMRHLDRARVQPLFAGPARGAFVAALVGGNVVVGGTDHHGVAGNGYWQRVVRVVLPELPRRDIER